MTTRHPVISEALSRLKDGEPSAVIVELDPRTRSSPALEDLRAAAVSLDIAVVSVPAVESDQVSTNSRLLQALASGAAIETAGGAVADQAAELLDRMTKRAPVAVLIEDLHWSDPGTLQALRTLPDVLGHVPICWVAGVVASGSRGRRVLEGLRRLGAATVKVDEVEAGEPSTSPLAFLQVAAVIGIEFDLDVAAQVLDRSVGSLLGEIQSAIAEGVLVESGSRLRFSDARVRDGLYEALPGPVRQSLHYEIAKEMIRPGTESEAVWHLTRSTGRLTENDLSVIRDAIARLAAVAPEDAAELAFQVSDLFPILDHHRIEFITTAAMHLGNTSRVGEALSLLERLNVSGLADHEEARLRLVAAHLHQAAGDDTEAMTHVRRALALPRLDDEMKLSLVKTQAVGHVNLGEAEEAARLTRPIIRAARRSPDPATKVSADLFASQLAFSQAQVTPALDLARQAAYSVEVTGTRPLHAPRIPELWLSTVMLSSDQAEEASELLLDGQRHAERRGLAWSVPYWHTVRAIERWLHSEIDDAAAEAETALHAADRLEIIRSVPLTRSVLAIVEIDRGNIKRARQLVKDATLPHRPRTYDIWTAAALVRIGDGGAELADRWLESHANLARLMSLPPQIWASLTDGRCSGRTVRELLPRIAAVASDHKVITSSVAQALAQRGTASKASGQEGRAVSGWESLTASELRVARLVVDGHTNRAIAEHLQVSVHTVGTHLRHVFTKLDINTRVELTRMALQHGVLPDGEQSERR